MAGVGCEWLGTGQGNHEGCPYMPPAPRLDSRSEAGMTVGLLAMKEVWECGLMGGSRTAPMEWVGVL